MKRQVVVRRLAERHLAEAYAWYAQQAPGLGLDFLDRFGHALNRIVEFPQSGPVVHLDYRRVLLQRFPYGVFYVVEDGLVVIAAVYHLARDPREMRKWLRP